MLPNTYHQKIQLKRSRTKLRRHERSLEMLRSILIYSYQTFLLRNYLSGQFLPPIVASTPV